MTTAQGLFKVAVKEHLGPGLRDLGFKGSGQAFTMPSETHFVMLGLQKSTSSSADLVRFTINVSVISRQIWAQVREERSHLPATPSPNTFYGDFAWQERIGTLLDGTDRWWTIRTEKDARSVAEAVLDAVRRAAVPAIEHHVKESASE